MNTLYAIVNKRTGIAEKVVNLSFNGTFVIAATPSISVRFEDPEQTGELVNDSFDIISGDAVTEVFSNNDAAVAAAEKSFANDEIVDAPVAPVEAPVEVEPAPVDVAPAEEVAPTE